MSYTLGMAARATGLSKSTVYRAIKAGRLSASRAEAGDYQIDPAELHRVFPIADPEPARSSNGAVKRGATPPEQDEIALENARLEAEVAASSLVTALLRQQLDETRQDRDHWRGQAQRLVVLPPPTGPRIDLHALPPRPSFVARLFGRS
jgi:excisionase family DNA binding protein